MAQSKAIKQLSDDAERLYEVRKLIEAKEAICKQETEALKVEREILQRKLIDGLNKQELSSVKLKSGDRVAKGVRRGVEVVNESLAIKWAIEARAVSVNKLIAAQKLREVDEMPAGFRLVESEYISINKAPKKKE